MTCEIPVEPEEFSASWFSRLLGQAGVAKGSDVTDIEFAGYVGTGEMSRNGRFRLCWSEPEGRPATVVVKLPSSDVAARDFSFQNGAYRSEYVFYSEVAPTVRVRTPMCWVARYDQAARRCVLVMEDMAESVQGDQFEGCTVDQVPLVIEQAVALHAPRWGDPTLDAVVFGPAEPQPPEVFGNYWEAAVSGCLDRLGHGFTDDVVQLVESFGPLVARWAAGPDRPLTITHRDFRPDNFLFGASQAAPPLTIVDWQTVAKGSGPSDVAYFLAGAFPVEQRRQLERDVVDEYRRRLNAAGVTYTADDCWHDFRWGSLLGVVIAVLATLMAAQTERGDRLFTLMINRHGQHAIDLGALELIEQAALA